MLKFLLPNKLVASLSTLYLSFFKSVISFIDFSQRLRNRRKSRTILFVFISQNISLDCFSISQEAMMPSMMFLNCFKVSENNLRSSWVRPRVFPKPEIELLDHYILNLVMISYNDFTVNSVLQILNRSAIIKLVKILSKVSTPIIFLKQKIF